MTLLGDVAAADGSIVILSHLNADPDAIGCSIAVYEFLKSKGLEPRMAAAGGVNALARNLIKKLDYRIEVNPPLDDVETLVLVDTSSFSQLMPMDVRGFAGRLFVIDHHIPEEALKARAVAGIFDESITSASEIVFRLLKEEGFSLNKNACLALITGIVTDTAHPQFARPETLRMVADLLECSGMDYPDVLNFITIPTEPSRKIAHLKSASRLEMAKLGEWIIALSYVGSFEASAARALVKIGADVAFVASIEKGEARVSVRATNTFVKKTGINFAKEYAPRLVKMLGGSGGGHVAAISVNGKFEGTEAELLELCLNLLEALIKEKGQA
jgi:nanoRNase/pAp phosphatase (c-di-AMP/oligoRNAs hydrolase)